MKNIVETACENEAELKLTRLVNFMDLYRTYLADAIAADAQLDHLASAGSASSKSVPEPPLGVTDCASFEQFISDSRLLQLAAAAASRESGFAVATPAPLKNSANSTCDDSTACC
jgi:hypothetical protein